MTATTEAYKWFHSPQEEKLVKTHLFAFIVVYSEICLTNHLRSTLSSWPTHRKQKISCHSKSISHLSWAWFSCSISPGCWLHFSARFYQLPAIYNSSIIPLPPPAQPLFDSLFVARACFTHRPHASSQRLLYMRWLLYGHMAI